MNVFPRARVVGVAALVALGVAILGGLATDIGPWYASLKRPPWQPPDVLFGPVWTLIYALCALSAATAWRATQDPQRRQALLAAWAFNAFFNVLWSLLFFRLQRPDWAQMEVGLLGLSVALLIMQSVRLSRVAGLVLVPYLLWVCFAAALNHAVVNLNAPFVGR